MSTKCRELAQVVALWLALAAVRWLAALPVVQPRIFRDELLHWQLARSFVTLRPDHVVHVRGVGPEGLVPDGVEAEDRLAAGDVRVRHGRRIRRELRTG
ncbi:MAG TPA: hypothetical protein VF461_19740 [Gemmatimonadaceae bacterium]